MPVLLLVAVPLLALPRIDLSGIAASRLSARLGRAVTIGALHVTPGRAVSLELRDATIANIDGGSAPDMLRLSRLAVRVGWLGLLRGDPRLDLVEAQGLTLLLERDAGRRRNWRFQGDPAGPAAPPDAAPPDRSGLPMIGDIQLSDSRIIFRTSSGSPLETRLDAASVSAAAPDVPIIVTVRGAYQAVPLSVEGELGTPRSLRAGRDPVRMAFTIAGQDVRLSFDGTSTDPLNFDRMAGRLTLQAASPATLVALAGGGDAPAIPFEVAGDATHDGSVWRLTGGRGLVDGAALEAPLLELTETDPASRVTVEARLARLELERLGSGGGGGSLALGQPDPELRANLIIDELLGAGHRATDLRLAALLTAQWLAVEELTATAYGSRITARGRLEPAAGGGRILGDASLAGGTIEGWRRAAGIRTLPLSGRPEAWLHVDAAGATLEAALRAGRIGLVVGVSGGRIAREVVEMASIDVRALFRTARGTVPLSCGLAVLSLRGGRGELAPLRLRAASGTIIGLGRIDPGAGTMDVVIGSERETTGPLALDVPVRLSGPIGDPSIGLGAWPASGRLSAGVLAGLPVQLRDQAERNPCYR